MIVIIQIIISLPWVYVNKIKKGWTETHREKERYFRVLGDHNHWTICFAVVPKQCDDSAGLRHLRIAKFIILMSSVSSHMLGYPDSYLREESKELTPGSAWFMGTRRPSGSKTEWKWVLTSISSWPGLCKYRASLACPFLKLIFARALLAKPLAYNRALKHFPVPTRLQNHCDGQFPE